MQLLHLFLEEPAWDASAMERAKQLYISHYRALPKSLERASADRIMAAMLGPDRCSAGPARSSSTCRTLVSTTRAHGCTTRACCCSQAGWHEQYS
jgi:hypothetical protein